VTDDFTFDPDVDPIQLERVTGGRTRASVQLISGLDVFGAWATGDSQAFRALIVALMEVADGATARVDRSARLIDDLTSGNRVLRDQLREALDDVENLRSEREALKADIAHRAGEMMAEITRLKANLGAATVQQAMTPELAEVVRERDQLRRAHAAEKIRADEAVAARQEYADEAVKEFNEVREQLALLRMQVRALTNERDKLRSAFVTEKRRADAAVARMFDLEERAAAEADRDHMPKGRFDRFSNTLWVNATHQQFWQNAVDAANAADQAFEGASWKEGARYLKLASMWINLLNAASSQRVMQVE
jgi:hypothetical protein